MKKLLLILLPIALLCACGAPAAAPDPHAGMVQVVSGSGSTWITPIEGLAVNERSAADFTQVDGRLSYAGPFRRGVDVSEHQGEIDWPAVKQSGMADFAFIRAGYRGYTQGLIQEDPFFRRNAEGASAEGIDVGIYFFSQAVTPFEAVEEAQFLLSLLADYAVTFPVVYDWEPIMAGGSRTETIPDRETLTDCALAFCQTIESAGYTAAVYFYRDLGYFSYDLGRLAAYPFWVGAPGDAPDFYYAHDYWQYSYTGAVPGIEGDVDLDLYFTSQAAK